MFKNYFLITFRSLLKNKLYVSINIVGMAVAVACCMVAWFAYEFDSSFDALHKNGNTVYRVSSMREFEGTTTRYGYGPLPLGEVVRQNIQDLDKVARYSRSWSDFKVKDDIFDAGLRYVDPEFFEIFSFEFIAGDPAALKDRSHVFISENMAVRLFGSPYAVGKAITQVYGTALKEVEVAGVFKDQPNNSSFYHNASFMHYDNFFEEFSDVKEDDWTGRNTLFVQIGNEGRLETALRQLQPYKEYNNKVREDFVISEFALDRFADMAHSDRSDNTAKMTWIAPPIAVVPGTATMAILILLIACFNLTNTTIAISSRRLKEIGIRKVMGGLRSQLIVQFIGETLFICLAALLLGLVLTEVLVNGWNVMWEFMHLTTHYLDNLGLPFFLGGILVFTSVVAGSYPAFYISHFEPVSILKGKMKFGGTNYFTRILLGLQYAISLIGIISAIAFVENARYQRDYDLGLDVRGSVLTFVKDLNEFETYRHALEQNPDILSISGASQSIFSSWDNDPVKYSTKQLEVDIIAVDDNYLEAMGLELLEGRNFKEDSETDRRESVIVTRKMADAFAWKEPLGKEIRWHDTVKLYVVGVVKDIYTNGLWREMEPMMIRCEAPENYSQLIVSAPPGKISEVNEFMRIKWKEIFPNRLYNGWFLSEGVSEAEDVNINLVKMFLFLGAVAMMLSGTGLFSLVSLNIIKRMKEIGVRKVLGASILNITRIINMEFFIILGVASLAGCYLSFKLVGMLMSTIWRYYQSTTLSTFVISILLMFVISGLTVGFKVYSAASMNPVNTLRDE